MAWATASRRKVFRTTAVTLVGLGIVIITLWRSPGAELVLFHAVWIGLALGAMRASPGRLRVGAFVGLVVGLAIVVEVDDLRNHYEVGDTLFELLLDLPAFVAVIVMARRQQRVLATEHQAAVTEYRRNERQRAFFANAAHALRTPITIARGHTEMAMRAASDPKVKADLTVVLEELDRLTSAADRNLRLSIAGEVDAQLLRPVDAHELVRTTVERWAPTAQRAWSAEARGETCEMLADPDQLTEALDALIENALLATTSGGSIVVRSEVDAHSIVLSVVDDGCGVDGVDPNKLFEPFEQGPRRSTETAGGTGLGLTVVRAIAIAHGGSAEMESKPGTGTTVRMILPRSNGRTRQQSPGGQNPVVTA